MESGISDAQPQRHPLAAVRAARGWSYRDLAEAVASQSRILGVPMAARREKAWRWENWGVVPDADSQRALAMALGVTPARLGVRPWPAWLPTGTELSADLAWTAEGTLTALRELLADIDEDRRAFAVAGPAVLADALAAWLGVAGLAGDVSALRSVGVTASVGAAGGGGERPPVAGEGPGDSAAGGVRARRLAGAGYPEDDGGSAGRECDDDISAWLRMHAATMPSLLRAARIADPVVLRRKLDADLRLIVDLLGVAEPGGPLYQAAAKITLLAGRRCVRDGLHGPAQRYFLTALRCAHSAGDDCLGASILGVVGRHIAAVGDEVTAGRFRDLAEDVRCGAERVAFAESMR